MKTQNWGVTLQSMKDLATWRLLLDGDQAGACNMARDVAILEGVAEGGGRPTLRPRRCITRSRRGASLQRQRFGLGLRGGSRGGRRRGGSRGRRGSGGEDPG